MAIRVIAVAPLLLIKHPLGDGPHVLVKLNDSGTGRIVTPGVVPVSMMLAPFFVAMFDVYVPAVGVLASPTSWMETAVPATMVAEVNV
jgi:hypothetical protein